MKDRTNELMGQIISAWKQLKPAIDEIVADYEKPDPKPEAKPLLADAKVGDELEADDGIQRIVKEKGDNYVKTVGGDIYTLDGVWLRHGTCPNPNFKIVRLIPKLDPIAELLAKYPHIERDLTTVQVGDTVLMSDGCRKMVTCNWFNEMRSGFDIDYAIVYYKVGIKSKSCASWLYSGKASADECNIICLGIIARAVKEYTFMEACDLLDSGEAEAVHLPESCTYMGLENGLYETRYKDNKEYAHVRRISKFERLATNWQIYKK